MTRADMITILALSLTGCDMRPHHAEWQAKCVESHTEMIMVPSYNPALKTTTLMPQYYDECDRSEYVCVAGKDGSTTCPAKEG